MFYISPPNERAGCSGPHASLLSKIFHDDLQTNASRGYTFHRITKHPAALWRTIPPATSMRTFGECSSDSNAILTSMFEPHGNTRSETESHRCSATLDSLLRSLPDPILSFKSRFSQFFSSFSAPPNQRLNLYLCP